jgi:REP element-mobilizing transposase RayT
MPCYLFTFHGYGTWIPSHKRGYVHRTKGIQAVDANIGAHYSLNQRLDKVVFNTDIQTHLIDATLHAGDHLSIRIHGIATETTHVHILLSWRTNTQWKQIRTSLRSGLSRHLNEQLTRRTWFAKNGSRKRVLERPHFEYLMTNYLPNHSGLTWFEKQ